MQDNNAGGSSLPRLSVPGGVFVAHVKKGYEDRARHIKKMLDDLGAPWEYMLEGDLCEFSPALKAKYFAPGAKMSPGAFSCSLKHIYICEQIVERNLPGALVLEDDIILHHCFPAVFHRSMQELHAWQKNCGDKGVIANYEDTRLRFVERSRREHGRVLYPGRSDRMAGCYYIDNRAAQILLDTMHREGGMDRPIDLYHNYLLKKGLIDYLWCQPTVATQGSHNGLYRSGINLTKTRFQERKWLVTRAYRRFLYYLR